ncbi:MAG: hypothetical protein NC390_05220 [Fusobacterium sp.]|nr:hypothetical protein [Fusobacterium sp.]
MMLNNDAPSSNPAPQQSYSAGGSDNRPQEEVPRFYSAGGNDEHQQRYSRPQRPSYDNRNNNYNRGGYNNNRPQNNNRYQNNNNNRGGYGQRPQNNNRYQNNNNRGGYNNNRPQGGGNRFQNNNRRPMQNRNRAPKQLLVSKEQLAQIELLYKMMMPLPNPDAHEVIGEKIGLEPRKVFFGINLIRQKMMLPKLPFPKRKLAISPDQLFAIKNLYGLLLPLPPIGCHKIIAAQLKMDEWRVHVGIGLIRAQMGLPRWNEERTDVPEVLIEKTKQSNAAKAQKEAEKLAKVAAEKVEEPKVKEEAPVEEVKEKPKRGRKPKAHE